MAIFLFARVSDVFQQSKFISQGDINYLKFLQNSYRDFFNVI